MSAARLREAAKVLRERAEGVDPHLGWSFSGGGLREDGTEPGSSGLIEFITILSPSVALALADWLDAAARYAIPDPHGPGCDCCPCCEKDRNAFRVADAILGGDR